MVSSFISAVTTHSKTRYVSIEGSISGTDVSFSVDPVQQTKILTKNFLAKITIPDRFLSCAVFGVSKDGSLRSAELLAGRLLFNIRKKGTLDDIRKELFFDQIDAIVLCGGYENSGNEYINEMILTISNSESFLKNRPAMIFSGSKDAASFAQYNFSPLTDFFQVDNFIDDHSMSLDLLIHRKIFLKKFYRDPLPDMKKTGSHHYFDVLAKFNEAFCGKYSNMVLTTLFTDNFAVLSRTERAGGRYFNKMYGISGDMDSLLAEDFSAGYRSFFTEKAHCKDPFKETYDVLPLVVENTEHFIRPDRICGISVCDNFSFERFVDLLCDPDLLRGAVEFVFDKEGLYLGAGLMFLDNDGDFSDWLVESSYCENFTAGWIVIPDGDFIKNKEALSLSINGNESDVVNTYLWGKRYFLTVEPFSVIEIQALGKVFFEGSGKKKILRTGRSSRTIVIDLRKEKS